MATVLTDHREQPELPDADDAAEDLAGVRLREGLPVRVVVDVDVHLRHLQPPSSDGGTTTPRHKVARRGRCARATEREREREKVVVKRCVLTRTRARSLTHSLLPHARTHPHPLRSPTHSRSFSLLSLERLLLACSLLRSAPAGRAARGGAPRPSRRCTRPRAASPRATTRCRRTHAPVRPLLVVVVVATRREDPSVPRRALDLRRRKFTRPSSSHPFTLMYSAPTSIWKCDISFDRTTHPPRATRASSRTRPRCPPRATAARTTGRCTACSSPRAPARRPRNDRAVADRAAP